jgi:MFS transporter, Spinster family, sphingosine-1-phosphate transporter
MARPDVLTSPANEAPKPDQRTGSAALYTPSLLTTINFVNYLDRMVVVTMYDDLRRIFHLDNGQLGALSTAFYIVHAAATIPFGWASDRFDRRRVIAFGVLSWSLATLGSAYALGFVSLLFLRGAVGIGEAAYGPASNALLCELGPKRKARLNAIYNGGMFAGACAGLWIGGALGFPRAFQLVALPGFALGLLAFTLPVSATRTRLGPDRQHRSLRGVLREMGDGIRCTLRIRTLRWMLASAVMVSFAAGGYVTWIVDFTVRVKGMSQAQARPLYAAIALTGGVLGVLAGGFVADRLQARTPRGRVLTMALGFFAAFPFCIGVIFIDHGVPYIVVAWLLMFFLPFYNGPMPAVIDDVVDDDDATSAQAAFVPFLHILGTGLAALVVGYASEIPGIGLRGAFALPALATLLAGLLAYRASLFVAADMHAKRARAQTKAGSACG